VVGSGNTKYAAPNAGLGNSSRGVPGFEPERDAMDSSKAKRAKVQWECMNANKVAQKQQLYRRRICWNARMIRVVPSKTIENLIDLIILGY